MNTKVLFRYTKIILLTAILFLFGLYWAVRLVTPSGSIESFYDEPKNSVDVLVVGGSHIMCSVSATGLYDQTGLTAYNLSTWSQPVWVSYHYIIEALKYQTPEVVVLDAFGSFYDRSYLTGVDVDLVSDDFAQLMKPSLNLLRLNLTRRRVQVTPKVWGEYLNIVKYHNRITELEQSDFDKILKNDSTTAKGYGPFFTTEDFSDYSYPVTDQQTALYPYAEEYLVKIIQLLQEKNIKLVLAKMPHVADENDMMLVNRIRQIAEEYQVDFLDFCSTNALELDFATDFSDHGHLNYFGSKKATAAVAEYLNHLGLEPRHTEAVESKWREASAIESDDMAKMEIKLSTTFAQMADRAAQHANTSILLAKQDNGLLNAEDYQKMELLLAGTVFEMSADTLLSNDLFVYTEAKLLVGEAALDWCRQRGIRMVSAPEVEILSGDVNYSFGRAGLNLAMYDNAQENIYYYVSYAKEHDYTPYTR